MFSPLSIISINILHLLVQTDRAAMLDEIVEYVRFLRLQVKVNYYCDSLLQIQTNVNPLVTQWGISPSIDITRVRFLALLHRDLGVA